MSENIKQINQGNRELLLVGVLHNARSISMNIMQKIVDYANKKRKVCYYIEFDKNLKNFDLKGKIPATSEFTTKFIIPYLKKEYGNLYNNLCIRGWDSRQSLIGQHNQNILYTDQIFMIPIKNIQKMIDKLPNNYKVNEKEYPGEIGKYLNFRFNEENTYFSLRKNDKNSQFDWLIENIKGYNNYLKNNNKPFKKFDEYTLKDLINTMGKKNILDLVEYIRKAFANVSDLMLLEKILKKSNNINYIIFMGLNHYKNINSYFKELNIK